MHNKDEKGYKKDAYITIVKNLLGVSSKLLDYRNAVLTSVDQVCSPVFHSTMANVFFRSSKLLLTSCSKTVWNCQFFVAFQSVPEKT